MKKTYSLSDFASVKKDFFYAYSPNCKDYVTFTEEKDCVVNTFNEKINDFDYVSMITLDRFAPGTKVTTHCSFEKFGAPLVVFTDDLGPDAFGRPTYGLHFEVVAFEEGCNVWHIVPAAPGAEKPIKPTKIGLTRFPIADNSIIELTVEFLEKKILITINGNPLEVAHEDLPERFHVGFTACEGINRFYDYTVETR